MPSSRQKQHGERGHRNQRHFRNPRNNKNDYRYDQGQSRNKTGVRGGKHTYSSRDTYKDQYRHTDHRVKNNNRDHNANDDDGRPASRQRHGRFTPRGERDTGSLSRDESINKHTANNGHESKDHTPAPYKEPYRQVDSRNRKTDRAHNGQSVQDNDGRPSSRERQGRFTARDRKGTDKPHHLSTDESNNKHSPDDCNELTDHIPAPRSGRNESHPTNSRDAVPRYHQKDQRRDIDGSDNHYEDRKWRDNPSHHRRGQQRMFVNSSHRSYENEFDDRPQNGAGRQKFYRGRGRGGKKPEYSKPRTSCNPDTHSDRNPPSDHQHVSEKSAVSTPYIDDSKTRTNSTRPPPGFEHSSTVNGRPSIDDIECSSPR